MYPCCVEISKIENDAIVNYVKNKYDGELTDINNYNNSIFITFEGDKFTSGIYISFSQFKKIVRNYKLKKILNENIS